MKPTILVVEDNFDNMTLVTWLLEDAGYAHVGVGSAEEALDVLQTRSFDLVLMDISLPGMDGKEATRRIRAVPRHASLPIIAVTAHAIAEEERAIRESGVDELILKPIDAARLLQIMEDCLCSAASHGAGPASRTDAAPAGDPTREPGSHPAARGPAFESRAPSQ